MNPEELGREYIDGVTSSFGTLPPERYPYLAGNLPAMMSGGSDQRFGFGIDMLIAGFAAQVDQKASGRR